MEQEYQLRRCKVCNKVKKRTHVGMYDAKNKKWVQEDGKDWNGHVCGDCHCKKVLDRKMKRYYALKEGKDIRTRRVLNVEKLLKEE